MNRARGVMPSLISLLASMLFLLPAAPARGAQPQVKDGANFFSSGAVRKANDTIADIKQRYGKDLMIETFAEIPADMQDRYRRDGKEKFFQEWVTERGRAEGLNGVELLICKSPARVEVGVGSDTRAQAFTDSDRDRLRDVIVNGFKDKRYDDALLDAVNLVDRTMGDHLRGTRSNEAPVPAPSARTTPGSSSPPPSASPAPRPRGSTPAPSGGLCGRFSFSGLICLGVVVVGVMLIMRLVRGGGNRNYPGGGSPGNPGGPTYGGGTGYPPNYPSGGGGFGRGLLGGLLGGVLGGWATNAYRDHQAGAAPPPTGGGGVFGGPPPGDGGSTYSSGSASGGDFGPSGDAGGSDFGGDVSSSGGDFGGGGDSGGGGGDSGTSGGDF